jgi:hypothetical protein
MSEFPNFMVVGGVKCGTTSLYYYMQAHPEICAPCKESYLFTPELNRQATSYAKRYTEPEYRELFRKSVTDQTQAAGEISSIYLHCYEEVVPEVWSVLGDVKIIIVLRNPVDRAYSHYSFFARDTRDSRTFEEAVEKELEGAELPKPLQYVAMGYYAAQVRAYLERFSQVKIVLFDDLVADTAKTMADIYEFLGVDPNSGTVPDTVYNASGFPKCKWIQSLIFKPTAFKMKLREFVVRHVIPEERFAWIMEKARSRNLKKIPLKPETRRFLSQHYRTHIEELEMLIHRDLSAWKSKE